MKHISALVFCLYFLTVSVVYAGTLNVTVRQGTTTGPVVQGAFVCIFQNNTSTQIGPTQIANGNGVATFNMGATSQTVTVRAFSGGNLRSENSVVVGATLTANLTLALQGNGTFPNPCLTTTSPPATQPPGGTGQSNLQRDQMRAAIVKANYFAMNLYPIFSHARCIHCHGGVVPGNNTIRVNHRDTGGSACTNCHGGLTQAQQTEWRVVSTARFVNLGAANTATREASITVKPWTEICKMVRTFFTTDTALTSHVQNDALIGWAFAPTSQQRSPSGAAPENQANLHARVQQWVALGKPCGLEPVTVRPGMAIR